MDAQVEPDLWRVENVELLIGVFDTRKRFFHELRAQHLTARGENALARKY